MNQNRIKPTQEEKAAYVSSYYGQKVLTDGVETYNVSTVFNLKHESFYLLLTPLSDITDEDAIEVARLQRHGISKDKINLHFDDSDPEFAICISSNINDYYETVNCFTYQYLQSKGYALPWMQYSVEQLISFSWLKLKQKGGGGNG